MQRKLLHGTNTTFIFIVFLLLGFAKNKFVGSDTASELLKAVVGFYLSSTERKNQPLRLVFSLVSYLHLQSVILHLAQPTQKSALEEGFYTHRHHHCLAGCVGLFRMHCIFSIATGTFLSIVAEKNKTQYIYPSGISRRETKI